MEQSIPTVLLTHMAKEEGLLWQAILKLQGLDVIWKPELDNIYEYVRSSRPQLLILSIDASKNDTLISGTVCRWCQSHVRNLSLFLVNSHRLEVDELERRWAIRRGAIDVLPKLTTSNALLSIGKALKPIGHQLKPGILPLVLQLVEKNTPPITLPPAEETIEDPEETTTQETETEFTFYRGVKVPKFSIASRNKKNLTYRGLPVKINQTQQQ